MSEERDNRLMKELVEHMPNSWAGEVGGNRRQMFSGHIPPLDEVLKEPIPEGTKVTFSNLDSTSEFETTMQTKLVNAVGLPPSLMSETMSSEIAKRVKAKIGYMRMGVKIHRAIVKKGARENHHGSDIALNTDALLTRLRTIPADQLPILDKQIDLWLQTSYQSVVEFFQRVVSPLHMSRTFVERKSDVYSSQDGWELFMQYSGDDEIWVLRDPNGTDVESYKFLSDVTDKHPYTLFSYEERFGRSGYTEMDIKYGPSHFPEGTVVEVFHDTMTAPKQFTVNFITVIGARNWLLEFKERKADDSRVFAGQAEMFNVQHVRKIISRGKGNIDLRPDCSEYGPIDLELLTHQCHELITEFIGDEKYEMPKVRKGETFFGSLPRLMIAIEQKLGIREDNLGKWFDEGKFHTQMASHGFGRLITPFNPETMRSDSFYVINVPKLVKFVKKYPDRLYMTLRQSEKMEKERDLRESNERVW